MAEFTRGQSFQLNDTVTSTKLHNLIDLATIANIVNADISASAAISDTKLAQITTAAKVSARALTQLTSLPTGAGYIPSANLATIPNASLLPISLASWVDGVSFKNLASIVSDAGLIPAVNRLKIKCGSFTRDMTSATGSVAITGVGFTPKAILFMSAVNGTSSFDYLSWGMSDAGTNNGFGLYDTGTQAINSDRCINAYTTVSAAQLASISTFDSDGFTLSWIKSGSPTGTLTVMYLAIG